MSTVNWKRFAGQLLTQEMKLPFLYKRHLRGGGKCANGHASDWPTDWQTEPDWLADWLADQPTDRL